MSLGKKIKHHIDDIKCDTKNYSSKEQFVVLSFRKGYLDRKDEDHHSDLDNDNKAPDT